LNEKGWGFAGSDKIAGYDDGDDLSAARFFFCAKATQKDRGTDNDHMTVKPTDLMRYLCRLVTPAGGTVLDPFMGSGSTGKAAMLEGFKFIGIELDPEYVELSRERIVAAQCEASGL
jgi:site-specific DNA-methyltransferase (adenine-specific)